MTTPKHRPKRPFLKPEMQMILCSETDIIATSGDENEGEWDREIFR